MDEGVDEGVGILQGQGLVADPVVYAEAAAETEASEMIDCGGMMLGIGMPYSCL